MTFCIGRRAVCVIFGCGFFVVLLSFSFLYLPSTTHLLLPTELNVTVGINLASSYSTIALRHPNGNFTTEFANGSKAYQETMARLSLESSRHMAPPYNGPLGDTDDWQRLLLRKLRKLIGLPASSDVGALANQITKLIDLVATDPAIDFQVKRATISVTHLVALYQDDLQDACEYAKIEYLEIPYLFRPLLWETSPVFASYGLGLCEHFRYFNRCSSELENMTEWNLLTVDYSKKALTTSFTPMKNPFGLWEPDYRHTENFDLGFDELEKGSFSSAEIYWGLVGEEMHIIPERFPKDLPSLIVLTGDAANVTRFRKILESTFLPNKPVIYGDDIIFAAAKGTAEMYFRKVIWETIRRNQTTDAKTEMKEMEL